MRASNKTLVLMEPELSFVLKRLGVYKSMLAKWRTETDDVAMEINNAANMGPQAGGGSSGVPREVTFLEFLSKLELPLLLA